MLERIYRNFFSNEQGKLRSQHDKVYHGKTIKNFQILKMKIYSPLKMSRYVFQDFSQKIVIKELELFKCQFF